MSALLILALGGCVRENGDAATDRPTSFRVSLASGTAGTADAPNPFSPDGQPFTFDVQAIGPGGDAVDWDGFVRASVSPGRLVSVGGEVGANVRVRGGRAEGIEIVIALAYGDVRVWFEDVGYEPAEPGTSACEDGNDQDGDRRFDFPDDPGCFASNDQSEEDGWGGVGASDAIWFSNPTLADVQGRTSRSPLEGTSITVDQGDLVVTRVSVQGLYATDLAEPSYGHMYLFNFSTPAGVRVCDGLSRIDGIVGEFFGYTELSFPSWEAVPWDETGDCRVPEPTVLDAATLASPDTMESLEASLVRLGSVTLPTRFENCDRNGDGQVDFDDPDESACQAACDTDVGCSDAIQLENRGQVAVAMEGGAGPKAIVVLQGTVPETLGALRAGERLGEAVASVTGTLRQLEFLEPPWIVEPRCPDDFVVDGAPSPSTEACIDRRTEEDDEP